MTGTKTRIKTQPALNPHDIRELKSKLHHLKPIVIIGNNGLTDAVIQEIDRALSDHELIKVRADVSKNDELAAISDKICASTKSTLIQTIGHIIAVYRKNPLAEDGVAE